MLAQGLIEDVEIIRLEALANRAHPLPGSEHPIVRVTQYPTGTPFARMRAEGVQAVSLPKVGLDALRRSNPREGDPSRGS